MHMSSWNPPPWHRPGLGLILLGVALLSSPSAEAARKCRVAVVIDEHLEDRREDSARVGAAVMKRFAQRSDVVVVDPEQARKVRRALGDQPLADADIPGLVTALDADLLVVGSAWLSKAESPLERVEAYDATASVRLVTSDSARILAYEDAKSIGSHFGTNQALRRAIDGLGEDIYERLLKAFEEGCGGPRIFQLVVHLSGAVGPDSTAEVLGALEGIEGVDAARLTFQNPKSLRVELESELSPLALSRAISGLGRGVRIHSMSGRRLEAGFVLGEILSVELVATPFSAGKGARSARYAPLARELPEQLGHGLAQLDVVTLPSGGALVSRAAARARARGRVILEGRYDRAPGPRSSPANGAASSGLALQVSARLLAAHARSELLAEQALCPLDAIPACVSALTERMKAALPAELEAKKTEVAARGSRLPPPPEHLGLTLPSSFEGIYPAQTPYYDRHPVGTVEVRNLAPDRITDIRLEYTLEGFSKRPHQVLVGWVDPEKMREAQIRLELEETKLAAQTKNRAATLRVKASYVIDETRYEQHKDLSVMVFDRNAHRWRRDGGRAVAAFVTHREPPIEALVREAEAALARSGEGEGASRAHPLARPVALYIALSKLRYRPDAVNPFNPDELDRVLFPSETLERGAGDCDDLAVLYAALLEAWAIPASLVQIPGHVFAMAKLPILPSALGALTDDPDRFVVMKGSVWVPVETTEVGKRFEDAWSLAAKALAATRRAGVEPTIIEIRDAWRAGYLPFDVEEGASGLRVAVDSAAVADALHTYEAERRARVEAAMAEVANASGAKGKNLAGVRLAKLGELEAAGEAFLESTTADPSAPEPLSNLGNVDLLLRSPAVALGRYEAALALEGPPLAIRYNAVVASHLVQASDASEQSRSTFERHLTALCEASRAACEEMYDRIFGQPSLTAGRGPVSLVGLRRRLEAQLGKVPREAATTAALVGDMHVSEHLHWLE